jgi:hypothetical protein
MNEPDDPNLTTDPADSPRATDPLRSTDFITGTASTLESAPDSCAPGDQIPTVPGYRVLREIARGGMGRVLAAYDTVLDRDVALKILLPGTRADRFVRESKITARLPHPGIPPVHSEDHCRRTERAGLRCAARPGRFQAATGGFGGRVRAESQGKRLIPLQ